MQKEKKNKIINLIVNIVVAIILVFVFVITINILLSNGKGYVDMFGTASVAVETDSMNPEGNIAKTKDLSEYSIKGFKQGDLIYVKVLKDDEKASLKEGDVVTYYYDINDDGVKEINTHRIIAVRPPLADGSTAYVTRGDNNPDAMTEIIATSDVIGVYKGHKAAGLGKVSMFFHTSTGFLVCVVVPAFLILVYCIFLLVKSILDKRKAEMQSQLAEAKANAGAVLSEEEKAKILEEEKEKIRQELLAEMANKNAEDTTEEPKE